LLITEFGLTQLSGGFYLTNYLILDAPWGPWTRVCYAATAVVAIVVTWKALALTTRVASVIERFGLVEIVGFCLLVDGATAGTLDSYDGMYPDSRVHGLLFFLSLAGLSTGSFYIVRTRISWRTNLGCVIAVLIGLVVLSGDRVPIYRALAGASHEHGRALTMVRTLTDHDGDGFSPWFDGGDCDDHDPTTYPLSPQHDCLGWRQGRPFPSPEAVHAETQKSAPRLVLLLTIDAFRCGFGVGDSEALRSACPNLTRMAHEGWARLDAHTPVPNTASSLTILMTGDPTTDPLDHPRDRPTLPQRFRESGYRTEVLVSFPLILSDVALHTSFDDVNNEFLSTPNSPFRGDGISSRVLERASAILDQPDQRAFLWAHYPDPHFPFVSDGSPLKRATIEDYAKVIQRTDAAVGRLLSELSQHPNASEVLVLVTADHGEEFGEHQEHYHGFTLYEEAVRVPIIAWSPQDHRRFVHSAPPMTNVEIGGYLLDAIGSSGSWSSIATTDILLRTVISDQQFGVISGDWKLIYNATRNTTYLFDLSHDPQEVQNLAEVHPDKVAELGRTLGRLLSPPPRSKNNTSRLQALSGHSAPVRSLGDVTNVN
jgi:hypothetical protein